MDTSHDKKPQFRDIGVILRANWNRTVVQTRGSSILQILDAPKMFHCVLHSELFRRGVNSAGGTSTV